MQWFSRVRRYFSGEEEPEASSSAPEAGPSAAPQGTPGGFLAQRQVAVPRQPVLQNAGFGAAGGVQGLDWYKARLKVDADGDVAEEFLQEPREREHARKRPPDKALYKVQKRSIRQAQLDGSQLAVDGGDVRVLPGDKSSSSTRAQ